MFHKQQNAPVVCTQDVRQCPDGTSVGRQGPKCEFKACSVNNQEKACNASGGKVSKQDCYCSNTKDFYNSCAIGACTCTPDPKNKKQVKACDCGQGKCWDGKKCASINPNPGNVGGDRDRHGCIGSAGYSWCEAKKKCLRGWEEACGTSNNCAKNGEKVYDMASKGPVSCCSGLVLEPCVGTCTPSILGRCILK